MDVSIPKTLAELLIGIANELLEAWPDPGDAINEDEAKEYAENIAKVTLVRDDLAKRANLSTELALP